MWEKGHPWEDNIWTKSWRWEDGLCSYLAREDGRKAWRSRERAVFGANQGEKGWLAWRAGRESSGSWGQRGREVGLVRILDKCRDLPLLCMRSAIGGFWGEEQYELNLHWKLIGEKKSYSVLDLFLLNSVFYCFCYKIRMLPLAWNMQENSFSRLWPLKAYQFFIHIKKKSCRKENNMSCWRFTETSWSDLHG